MMAASTNALTFFALEAGDCLEQMDAAVARGAAAGAGAGAPADGFVAASRRLRGSAVMYRVTGMVDLAGAVERVGRAVAAGHIPWSADVAGAVAGGVDALKVLLRSVRDWGPREDARVAREVGSLAQFGVGSERIVPITELAPADGQPQLVRTRPPSPTGPALQSALAEGIAKLSQLAEEPLTEAAVAPRPEITTPTVRVTADGDGVVPIESLLYRGPAALDRARSLRRTLRAAPPGSATAREVLDELFDLMDLATTTA